MAYRVENTFALRFGENNGVDRRQKGKSMAVQEARPIARATLGQIENRLPDNTRIAKDLKSRGVGALQGLVVNKNVFEVPSSKEIEPMETSMVVAKVPRDMRDVVDIDAGDFENDFACAEYASEIYNYLRKRETTFQVPTNYIQSQVQVNARMRAILVDWLVQVHDKFRLLQETLFLTVSFLDRYLSIDAKVDKANLQLVGVTAMFLASKIEEMYTPEIGDFVYITDNAYSASMIRSLETKMAKLLDYNFGDPLCIHFLRRDSKAAKADPEKHTLAKYFMELMLPDFESLCFPPSQRAAASLCLAMKITDNTVWNATVTHYSHYTEESLVPCMKRIAQLVLKSSNKQSKLLAVTTKYNRSKFYKISSLSCLSSPRIVELAQE